MNLFELYDGFTKIALASNEKLLSLTDGFRKTEEAIACTASAFYEIRRCLKIVIIPKRWLFFRHTLPIFLGIHQVFLRQIGFVWRKKTSPLGTFPIFKQRLARNLLTLLISFQLMAYMNTFARIVCLKFTTRHACICPQNKPKMCFQFSVKELMMNIN